MLYQCSHSSVRGSLILLFCSAFLPSFLRSLFPSPLLSFPLLPSLLLYCLSLILHLLWPLFAYSLCLCSLICCESSLPMCGSSTRIAYALALCIVASPPLHCRLLSIASASVLCIIAGPPPVCGPSWRITSFPCIVASGYWCQPDTHARGDAKAPQNTKPMFSIN